MDRPTATHSLCDRCHGLCENGAGWCWVHHPNGNEYPLVYIHHPSVHVLKARAAEGCALCCMILRTLVEYCKLDSESYKEDARSNVRSSLETEDDIRRIVTRARDAGVLQPAASSREVSDHQKRRTHTFHPAFEQERFEQLRWIFGSERVIISLRTLDAKNVGGKLPDSLSVVWLGSMKTCLFKCTSGLERIRFLVDHGTGFALL